MKNCIHPLKVGSVIKREGGLSFAVSDIMKLSKPSSFQVVPMTWIL